MVICYITNKYLFRKNLKYGNKYDWNMVKINLFISITIIPSLMLWLGMIIYKLPAISEEPPKWL